MTLNNKIMKINFSQYLLAIFIALVFASCNSSKKFNYESAYKFQLPSSNTSNKIAKQHIKKTESINHDSTITNAENLIVSTEKSIAISNNTFRTLPAVAKTSVSPSIKSSSKENIILSVKEIKKEIRIGFKHYKKEIKDRKKLNKGEKTHDNAILVAAVLLVLGLIIIVGGILLFDSIGVILASLIAAVGLIIFLIGLLKLLL